MQWPNEKGPKTSYDLQNTAQKTKDKALRTPQNLGGERK